MKTCISQLLVAMAALNPLIGFAGDASNFPTAAVAGDVTVASGEGLLGACTVGVKLTARGLHLRENAALGELAMPAYPENLLAAGIVGEAQVVFVLKEDGTIADARIARAMNSEFGTSALASVKRWRFKPLKWIDRPEATVVTATFVFSIFYEGLP